MKRLAMLIGISVFWVGLSMLFDGLNTLVLPAHLLHFSDAGHQATALGLIRFVGLTAGMVIMPIAGQWSDRMRSYWGRRATLIAGAALILGGLVLFAATRSVLTILVAYM